MINVGELFWPRPQGAPTTDERAAALRRDLDKLGETQWARDTDVALDEARRLYDAEDERLKVAESKATTYLALVGVLIPVLTTLGTSPWEGEVSQAKRIAGVSLLLLSILYLLVAGHWALRALSVGSLFRVDALDLAKVWSGPRNPRAALLRQVLFCVRRNCDRVNDKVTSVLMTHAYLRRAGLVLALLVVVQMAWMPAAKVVEQPQQSLREQNAPNAAPQNATTAPPPQRAGAVTHTTPLSHRPANQPDTAPKSK